MAGIGHRLGSAPLIVTCCLVASIVAFGAEYRLALAGLLGQDLSAIGDSNQLKHLDLALRKDSTVTGFRDGRPLSPRLIEREYTALDGVLTLCTRVYERPNSTNEFIRRIEIKANDVGRVVGGRIVLILPFALTEIETPDMLEAAWGRADAYGLDDEGTGTVAYDPNGRAHGAVFRYKRRRIVEITLQR